MKPSAASSEVVYVYGSGACRPAVLAAAVGASGGIACSIASASFLLLSSIAVHCLYRLHVCKDNGHKETL